MILEVPNGRLCYETEGAGVPCIVPVPGYQGYLTRTLSEELRGRFQFQKAQESHLPPSQALAPKVPAFRRVRRGFRTG